MGHTFTAYTDDRQLWLAFRQGDAAAYECIYRTHAGGLYAYAYNLVRNRQIAEDCIQDLFVYLYQHRQTLKDTDSIRFYLMRSLRRRLTVSGRKHHRIAFEMAADGFEIVPAPDHELIETQAAQERAFRVIEALGRLPKRQREAIYLLYFSGLAYTEVAQMMDLEVKSVYNLVHKAMVLLKKKLHYLKASLLLLAYCQDY